MTPQEILKRPYHRCFIRNDNGEYTALILEFQGCLSEGETLEDANYHLTNAALAWLETLIEMGQTVPEPIEHLWGLHGHLVPPNQRLVGAAKTARNLLADVMDQPADPKDKRWFDLEMRVGDVLRKLEAALATTKVGG